MGRKFFESHFTLLSSVVLKSLLTNEFPNATKCGHLPQKASKKLPPVRSWYVL